MPIDSPGSLLNSHILVIGNSAIVIQNGASMVWGLFNNFCQMSAMYEAWDYYTYMSYDLKQSLPPD